MTKYLYFRTFKLKPNIDKVVIILALIAFYSAITAADVLVDEFDGDKLKDYWTFNNRGNPASTVKLENGKCYIHVPAGGNDLIPGVDLAPTLTMDTPSGDFTVTTLYTGPTAESAAAGIVIFQDLFNQMHLLYGIGGPGGQNVWFMGGVNGAVPPVRDKDGNVRGVGWGHHLFTGNLGPQKKVYLRIVKSGNTYTSYYKFKDAEPWEQWLSADFPLQNPEVGLIVKNWNGAELTAEFEFFQLEGEGFNVKSTGKLPLTWGQIKK
jgi:hypothetical protein